MVEYTFNSRFKKLVQKLDSQKKTRVKNQIKKILSNPLAGKPMKNKRLNTREVYIDSFRLSYKLEGKTIIFLDLYHKDDQ